MVRPGRSSRTLVIIGLVAMLVGTLDPLEGSILILAGMVLLALGAVLGRSPHRLMLTAALALGTVGVSLLWAVSATGGFGGNTGRSMWWSLLLLPYPIGWFVALIGAIRLLREKPQTTQAPR
jgi:hypothetical protein